MSVALIGCLGLTKSKATIKVLNLNNLQFDSLRRQSISSDRGFKYVKEKTESDRFKEHLFTQENEEMSKQDWKRINELIRKYK
jgi:hypothetical protein